MMEEKRVEINKNGTLEVVIHAYQDHAKTNLLMVWVILWTLAGVGIISQFFVDQVEGFTTYLIVWLGFWAYFEYKVIYAFRWRKLGLERIRLDEGILQISREIAGRSLPARYEVDWIKNFRLKTVNEKNITYALSKGYWNPGDERILFDYKGKEILFGMELAENESKKLVKLFTRAVQEAQQESD